MNNFPQIFNYQGAQVRTVTIDGNVWFVAKDICDILEISNPTVAIQRLDEDERSKFNLGRQGETNVVNESGLYELIFGSRKQEAQDFKKWVKREVLPTIRKHGAYMTPETIEKTLADPDFIIGLASKLKQANEEKARLQAQIEADRPKVVFAESLEVSKDSILVADLAKLLRQNGIFIGEKRLFEWLRENGYLIKSGSERNMPTQRSMEMNLFEIRIGSRMGSDGTSRITRTPKVTGKGQIYFINKFKQSVTAS